ncbi:MAG: tripartite tricarboxylate transporter TctB family protein [Limnobacter sp.]|uniref:tripartite tricarboxylate transporter TctB family protein n=1 Tax=Limnobacter sp. TaxID=2003368 RepID=UPI00391B4B62
MPKDLRDFWSGLLYLIVGAAGYALAQDYEMGTAIKMGPGYFPIVLSGLLMLIGVLAIGRSFIKEGEPLDGLAVKKILYVTASVVAFALLVEGAGLFIAVLALFVISAAASRFFDWKFSLIVGAGAGVFCCLVFVKGLGIPLPIIGSWFGV